VVNAALAECGQIEQPELPLRAAAEALHERCSGGCALETFSTTFNHHTTIIQSTKDGPSSSITGEPWRLRC
jgi:hypothetical protein